MFLTLDIAPTFEPFIGYTYMCEGQKRILFIAYDEWSYMTNADIYNDPNKEILTTHDSYMNVSKIFRSSPYYRHIDMVLKSIKRGLTAEDVAFYNFVIRPIGWEKYKIKRDDREASYIKKSIRAFKAVIDFCNPDLVIFCSWNDYYQVNNALNSNLNFYLREKGIEYLESGNLNYDMDPDLQQENFHKPPAIDFYKSMFRHANLFIEQPEIESHPEYDRDDEFDEICLNLQQIQLDNEKKYRGIPEALQTLARFIDCEIKSPGNFMRLRLHKVMKTLERRMYHDYEELMYQYVSEIKNADDYFGNPLCTFVRPAMHYTWHMLRAITDEYEKMLIDVPISKRKFCCSFASNKKKGILQKNSVKRLAQMKDKMIQEIKSEDNNSVNLKDLTKIRWEQIRTQNQELYRNQFIQSKKLDDEWKKVKTLLDRDIDGKKLSPEEKKYLDAHVGKYIARPPTDAEWDILYDYSLNGYKRIIDKIRNNRSISLEALSKAVHIDEYYLSDRLKLWEIECINGLWQGKPLDPPPNK